MGFFTPKGKQMAVKIGPVLNEQQFSDAGVLLSGGKIETYLAGSSTPAATYTTSAGTIAQANPIVLNTRGEVDNPIYLTTGILYKLVLKNSVGDVLRTFDNIEGINDNSSSIDQWINSGVEPTFISASQFTLSGDQTSAFHVNRRVKLLVTAGTVYGYISASAYGALTTVTVNLDSGVLDSGLSNIQLGLITYNNSSLPKVRTSQLEFDTGALGNRNILINSGFRINQRSYVSGAVLAAGAYAHDRWKAGASGGDYSFTQLNTNTQITIAAGKSLIQVVEDKNVHETAYVLSWQGTAQARVGISSITPSGAYAASPILITGQVAGSGMSVEFNTGTLGKAQLEAGSIATPFENRSYGAELALTQRYFYADSKYVSVLLSGVAVTGTTHPVPMRVTPTITGTEAGFTQVSATNLGLSYYQTTTNGMVLNFSAEL